MMETWLQEPSRIEVSKRQRPWRQWKVRVLLPLQSPCCSHRRGVSTTDEASRTRAVRTQVEDTRSKSRRRLAITKACKLGAISLAFCGAGCPASSRPHNMQLSSMRCSDATRDTLISGDVPTEVVYAWSRDCEEMPCGEGASLFVR